MTPSSACPCLRRAPAACQILRIISFTVTQLPAPNYHCRLGKDTAVREMPKHWWGHVVVDVGRQATHGCGDLIFSSHTTFVLTGVLTFTEYGETLVIKVWQDCGVGLWVGGCMVWGHRSCRERRRRMASWPAAAMPSSRAGRSCLPPPQVITWIAVTIMGLCIVASRKVHRRRWRRRGASHRRLHAVALGLTRARRSLHGLHCPTGPLPACLPAPACPQHYSVDVVVAFYTVPLVFYTMHRRWTTKRPVSDAWCAAAAAATAAPSCCVPPRPAAAGRRMCGPRRCCRAALTCRVPAALCAPRAGRTGRWRARRRLNCSRLTWRQGRTASWTAT